ncbi:MAG: NAD-dependent epimerase/dehydratase family protein [Vulcanibacillus sp.]
MKNILITGAKGFAGKNLTALLKQDKELNLLLIDIENTEKELEDYLEKADFIIHLAGVNRPKEEKEFEDGNYLFTKRIADLLIKKGKKAPVIMSSSIQAELDNPYGKSKKEGEDALIEYGKRMKADVYIYRLPNLFGKWGKPNYNSAVATFCYNISRDIPIQVSSRDNIVELLYIDDMMKEFSDVINGKKKYESYYYKIDKSYKKSLGEIVDLIYSFKKSREERSVPDMSNEFVKKLYSTYLSYLPENQFSYPLKMNIDNRGSFTEFIRTIDRGQVSINVSKPEIVKGNHWHHSKNEKFLVVSGKGVIRFRKIGSEEVIEYKVSGDKLEVVDIPTGYTHNIENLGDVDLVTVMWANEAFDPEKPDTFFEEV